MKNLVQKFKTQLTPLVYNNENLDHYLFKPLRAGLWGFLIVMFILLSIDSFSFILGRSKRLDKYDFIFAGLGFVLQVGETLLKNFF
jgi:hypothetical protein